MGLHCDHDLDLAHVHAIPFLPSRIIGLAALPDQYSILTFTVT
jgi:hypothetical protein